MSDFETAYQAFMRAGGFTQPCRSEQMEREQRQKTKPAPVALCPHGKTALTCPQCYISHERGNAI